jgi:hypothetical protein
MKTSAWKAVAVHQNKDIALFFSTNKDNALDGTRL